MSGDIPTAPLAWKYEKRKSLVPPGKERTLSSQMRRLHEWYMDAAKGAREFLLLKITKDHFLGEDLIHIEFDEFFSYSIKTPSTNLSSVSMFCK
jgi:hypothetical protein